MAVVVELLDGGNVVSGTETWWDEMEAVLEGRSDDFPVLSKVDPYGDVIISAEQFDELIEEARVLVSVPRAPIALIDRLRELAALGLSFQQPALRFRGD